VSSRADDAPAGPPSSVVRAAQDRLLERIDALEVADVSDVATCVDEERYEFGELLATGGLGLVRRAYDRRLGRTVAVKELRRADPVAERRFLFEAEITARLQHPGVVPIYDMGRFASGEPYYCMKLVEGRTLEQIIGDMDAEGRLGLLEHVLAAADAVAHAHRGGIIHRDLKPANILVGEFGETVVIDWGLAKDLAGEIAEPGAGAYPETEAGSTLTDVGAIVGTLRYMPPEQARGEVVDRRSDVFALGAVLFHVIVGRPPHEGLARGDLIARLAEGAVEDLGPLAPEAPRALVAIARRAMAPRADPRYADAGAFAEDLRRYLAGRRVGAHRYQAGELLRVWLRRHRAAVSVGAVATLALLTASVLYLWDLRGERDLAAAARRRAEVAESEALRRADAAVLAQARGALGEDVVAALGLLAQVELSKDANLRSARLTALAAQARGAPERVLRGHDRRIEHIAALSDGELVSVDMAGEVRRWDPRTGRGEVVADLDGGHGQVVAAAEVPVWVAVAGERGMIVRGDEPPEAIELGVLARSAYNTHRWELSRHGETLAALGRRHMLGRRFAAAYTWDLMAPTAVMRTLPFDHISRAVLSPDGATVATADEQHNTVLVEGQTARPLPALARLREFSPSGRYLLGTSISPPAIGIALSLIDGSSATLDGSVVAMTLDDHALALEDDPTVALLVKRRRLVLRSLATGELRWAADLEITKDVISAIWGYKGGFEVSPRGDRFALQLGQQWQIWSMATGKIEYTLDTGPHRRGVFLADGGFAVAHHTELWVWSPRPYAAAQLTAVAQASDSSHVIANTWEAGVPRVMRLPGGASRPVPCVKEMRLYQLLQVRDGLAVDRRGRVLFVDDAGEVCFDAGDGPRAIALRDRATTGALADIGEGFVVGMTNGQVMAWSAVDAEPVSWQLDAGIRGLWVVGDMRVVFAQTGSGAVVALRSGVAAPEAIGVSSPETHPYSVRVIMQPGMREAAVLLGDEDAVVFHDTERATRRRPVAFSVEPAAAYSPSGDRFAVALAGRGLLVLADPDDPGREMALPEEGRGLAFIDEEALAVVGESGALIRVDLAIGEVVTLRRDWARYPGVPTYVSATADGAVIHIGSTGIMIQPLDPVPRDSEGLRAWLAARGGLAER